jgi:capsular polysaccharide biosynthesis protein
VVVDPKQIASQINQETYNNLISEELNLDIIEFPRIRAENLQETDLVRVFIREKDAQKAKLILNSLFNHLKKQLDVKVNIEMKGIDSSIKSNNLEKSSLEEEIRIDKNKLSIIRQRKKEIETEMIDMRKRAAELEKEQRLALKKENRSESESLAMLLYSNEIQQSLRYLNTLNELLNSKKIEEENINLSIDNRKIKIKQIENQIENLNERRGRIDYSQLIKEPTSSISPVSPKMKLNVLIAGVLGLLIFTMLAFLIEYIETQKSKEQTE